MVQVRFVCPLAVQKPSQRFLEYVQGEKRLKQQLDYCAPKLTLTFLQFTT